MEIINLLSKTSSSSSKSIIKDEAAKTLKFNQTLRIKKIKENLKNYYPTFFFEMKKYNKEELIEKISELKKIKKEKEMEIDKNQLKGEFNKENESKMKDLLLKEIDEYGNKEEELNNQNDINTKNIILLENQDEIKSLKGENIAKKYNEMKSKNKNLIKIEDLIEKKGIIKLSKKEFTMKEKGNIETKEKDTFNENIISNNSNDPEMDYEQLERNKNNQSMDIGISRYPHHIFDNRKQNERKDLLNSDESIYQLLHNKKKNFTFIFK